MLGKKIINTGGVACTTDTTQILDAGTTQSTALYRFEDNANDTASGTGKFNKGGVFNGSSSIINDVLSGFTYDNKNITFSAWIKSSKTTSGNNVIIGQGISNADGGWGIATGYASAQKLSFSIAKPGVQSVIGSVTMNTGNWQHIVVIVDFADIGSGGTSAVKMYVDGIEDTGLTGNLTQNFDESSYNTSIGGTFTGSNARFFDGEIDQIRIFNKALNSTEVGTLYNETTTTANTLQVLGDTSCVAAYTFEGNANDLSTNYNGTATNVIYDYSGTASNITYAAGKFDKAAVFNGSSSYIDTNAKFTPDLMSFSAWVNPTNGSSYANIFSNRGGNSTNYKGIDFGITSSGNIYSRFDNGGSRGSSNSNSISLPLNTWTHLVFTINMSSSIQKVYKNGVFVYQETTSGSLVINNDFYIGRSFNAASYYWPGKIDQVRIFDKALSPGEVNSLYNETTTTAALGTISNPSTVAYYNCLLYTSPSPRDS